MATTTASPTRITVSTTLPKVGDNLPSIRSDRLIIRPLLPSDLEPFYTLRSQPEAMTDSGKQRPDADLSETRAKLKSLQPPYHNSHVYFGIFLKKSDDNEGELIGDGGVHKFRSDHTGWPEFGYKFKKEYWGRGYATEFARAFMEFWWSLPRMDAQILVASSSMDFQNTPKATEQVYAYTRKDNLASQKVLEKIGFEPFQGLNNGLVNWRKTFSREWDISLYGRDHITLHADGQLRF